MTWKDITVMQFQQLFELWNSPAHRDPLDVACEMCQICHDLTANQIDSLTTTELNKLCRDLDFLSSVPQWAPVDFVEVEGRRYRLVYDVRSIRAARYMEVKQFNAPGFVQGLHKVAASIVVPQRKTWYGRWKDAAYDASQHEQYANDLRQAPISAIHGSAVFFCKLYSVLIPIIKDYLTSTIPKEKRTEAQKALLDSCSLLAGSTTQQPLLSTSESLLAKRIASRLFNSSTTSVTSKRSAHMSVS